MKNEKFFTAIILSAGSARRMGYNKMLLTLGNKTVFERSVEAFEECEAIDEIIIAAPKASIEEYSEIVKKRKYTKVSSIVAGGETRQESVANAICNVSDECDFIAVHDGARPLIKPDSIEKVCEEAIVYGGAVASGVSVDTLKSVNEAGMITGTIDRETTVQVRTPQIFKKEILLYAHERAKEDGFEGTDECMLVERCNFPIKTVITGRENVKLTYPEDVLYMTEVLRARGAL